MYRIITLLYIMLFLTVAAAGHADTIFLKDGSTVKGIVVEEYQDRIIVSTEYGETEMPRDEIKKVQYDLQEQNLVSMADKYMVVGDYEKAYFYYEKAKKVNPHYREAIEGANYLSGYLFRKELTKKADHVTWRQDVENFERVETPVIESPDILLKRLLGMEISNKNGKDIVVTAVYKGMPADTAGVMEGDVISSVWGKLTGYLSCKQVGEDLTRPEHLEIKIHIDRSIRLQPDTLKQSQMKLLFDGLVLKGIERGSTAYGEGLRDGDLVLSVGGKTIRYTPFKDIVRSLKKSPQMVVIRRELVIWRKKEG